MLSLMGFPIDSTATTAPNALSVVRLNSTLKPTPSEQATETSFTDSYDGSLQNSNFQSWKASENNFKSFRLRNAPRSSNPFENARNGSALFGQQTLVTPNDGGRKILTGVGKIVVGALATQADSPLPGPGDAVGAGLISSGAKDIGIGALQMLRSSFPTFPESWPEDDGDGCQRSHALHRAVPRDERDSISHMGQFTPNPAGSLGKYFYPTQTQAKIFANSRLNNHNPVMWRATGVLPAGTPHDHITPATEGPAIFIHNPYLSSIKHVRIRERLK